MANNGHSDTHTLITSKIAAINARVSQNEDLIRRAEAAEVPASMDALLHRIEMFGRAKHDEGYYRDGDDLKSLNRERAAADLAEIRAMLAALKAQQPAPVASQFDRDVRSLVSRLSVLQVLLAEHHPEHHAAVHEAICNLEHESRSRTMFVARLENMQKNRDLWLTVTAVLSLLNDCDMLAQQPAPVDAEGLPPLPEPAQGGLAWQTFTADEVRQYQQEVACVLRKQADEIERLHDALKTAQYRGMVDERISYKGYSYGMRSMDGIRDLRRAIERDKNY